MTKQELIAKIKEVVNNEWDGAVGVCGDLEADSSPCINSTGTVVSLVELLYSETVDVGDYDTNSMNSSPINEYEIRYEDLEMPILIEIAGLLGIEYNAEENLQRLVDMSIEKIKQDIRDGDLTVIDELLKFLPVERLEGFLGLDE